MTFELVAYGTLKTAIKESVDTLLVEHNPPIKTKEEKLTDAGRSERVQYLKNKHPERHVQSQYLLKVIEVIDANPTYGEKEKAMILNGATLYVHSQINESYKKSTIGKVPYFGSYFNSPEKSRWGGSGFYDSLGFALDLREGNQPDNQDTFLLYKALLDFMKAEVFEPSSPITVFKPDHPFSDEKVIGYQVVNDINKLSKIVQELYGKLIDNAGKAYQADKSNKSVSTLFQTSLTPSIRDDYSKPEDKPKVFEIDQEAFDAFLDELGDENQEEKESQDETTFAVTLS